MSISVCRFGLPARSMVGIVQHAGANVRARYVLCRPLGQEAVRTAAMYRVLADRLAREGCETLRFDYHGTGDSPGDEADQTLCGWVEDTLAAHAHLRGDGDVPIHWFAMGLAAHLALRAAVRVAQPPSTIVLWEPVLNGPAYIEALLQAHRDELAREFGHPWQRLLRLGKVTEPQVPGDVLGFQIGAPLAAELQQLPELEVAPALRRGIRLVCATHAEHMPLFDAVKGHSALQLHEVEGRTNWMSSQAMGTAIVPPDVPRILLSTLHV